MDIKKTVLLFIPLISLLVLKEVIGLLEIFSFEVLIFPLIILMIIGIGAGIKRVYKAKAKIENKGVKITSNTHPKSEAESELYGVIEKGHNAIAILIDDNTKAVKYYYAHSKISLNKSINLKYLKIDGEQKKGSDYKITEKFVDDFSELINEKLPNDEKFIICANADLETLNFPMAIVNQHLEFEYISGSGSENLHSTKTYSNFNKFKNASFIRHKIHCTEKKILNEIYKEYRKDQLKNSKLIFFTEFEPCTTCMAVLSLEKKAKVFKDIQLYYQDLLLLLEKKQVFEGLNEDDTKFVEALLEDLIKKEEEKNKKKLERFILAN